MIPIYSKDLWSHCPADGNTNLTKTFAGRSVFGEAVSLRVQRPWLCCTEPPTCYLPHSEPVVPASDIDVNLIELETFKCETIGDAVVEVQCLVCRELHADRKLFSAYTKLMGTLP